MLEGCQYLASTDGQRLSAAVAYSEDAIEFAWSLAGRAETLRNLIAQVRHRLKLLSFVPVMETGRRSWGQMLGIPVLGRHFRSYLPDPNITLNPEDDIEKISRFMNQAYPSLNDLATPEQLREMTKTGYAFPDGWFALKHLPSGMEVGLALCGFCQEMEEGFICWTQVSPRFRHHGLGELIVRESIRRLCGKSRFITASGSLDAPFSLGDLYKRCGFEHTRQWTILGQGPTSGNRPLPFTPRGRDSGL
jgi:GNAT superfamily N-acetyltransferase